MELDEKLSRNTANKQLSSLTDNINKSALRCDSTLGNKIDQKVINDLLNEFKGSRIRLFSSAIKERLKPSLINLNQQLF